MTIYLTAKMLRFIIIFSAFSVIFVASIQPGPLYPPTKGEVWPKPQEQIKHDTYFKLIPSSFKFTEKGETCHILRAAVERYSHVLRSLYHLAWKHSRRTRQHADSAANHTVSNTPQNIEELQINLSAPCENHPQMGMDERYSLNVSAVSILSSESIWGILRGMETFSQLFYIADDFKDVFINATEIVDYPRYPHRGLLIDTSRHYISVANILKTLDAMEMNKMNVLHWHIVDDQSFPYESEKFPQLSERGAYDSTMTYSKNNIAHIVNYARDRGIRVLPEFDVPGHTRSWGEAYPNILTKCYSASEDFGYIDLSNNSSYVISLGPMNPAKNVTYKLIGELFKEIKERFPEKYLHVGGDEVELQCWQSNPDLQQFMRDHNMTDPSELHSYFMNRVIPLLEDIKPIVWQEVFDEGVPLSNDTIVQVWKQDNSNEMIRVLNAGHKLIYSASWYLDHLASGGDWVEYYKADPRQMIPKSMTKLNLEDIVGGEACMWGEVVDDRNLINRVWPRSSAVAEKLWSAETPRFSYYYRAPPSEVYYRLEEHACRMNRRGVNAQPPNGPGFCIAG